MFEKLLALAADAMAVFLDLMVGALIAYSFSHYWFGAPPPVWHLGVGAVLGFLPDLDAFRMFFKKGVITATGDHRLSLMHRPLIMLPLCTFVASLCGEYWAVMTFLCLLWHYVHDSRWLSVSDIAWFYPISNPELPYMDHPVWRDMYWLRPSSMSLTEVMLGTAILTVLANHYAGLLASTVLVLTLWVGATLVWGLHDISQRAKVI